MEEELLEQSKLRNRILFEILWVLTRKLDREGRKQMTPALTELNTRVTD